METTGEIDGLGLHGTFFEWRQGNRQRRDDNLGIRTQRELRIGDDLYVQNSNGDVRAIHGLVARRQVTEDFIDSGAFAAHPEDVAFLGSGKLADGRAVYRLRISPPHGEPYEIAIDTSSHLIDEKIYTEGDGQQFILYSDYRVIDGVLLPFTEVDSNGDHPYDITSHVQRVVVNQSIDASVFTPFVAASVDAPAPVTVPLREYGGLLFTNVTIKGKSLTFLLDSGAQGIVLDPHTAGALGLAPEGTLEIRGAGRTSGRGVVPLESLQIGGVSLPVHVASVVDLGNVVDGSVTVDGILGYPFFAAAAVAIDPDRMTMTIAKPGALPNNGDRIDVDTDRELPEIVATVDQVNGRFFIDTGNSGEVLLFKTFIEAHPGLVIYAGNHQVENRGIGGSNTAVSAMLGDLNLGPFNLYNRYANVILASGGAFADRTDAGNIGYGVLDNFVVTFDLANHSLYLRKAKRFDDGRYRPVYEH